ncbi:MAG TPA: bacterial proteasome activator family protein [Jiangellales bacterium]|nr:bacterial proteasome activator family protein [Jiangellales bacterium]
MTEPNQPSRPQPTGDDDPADGGEQTHVVVVGPDGRPVGVALSSDSEGGRDDEDGGRSVADLVEQPAKVMRIGSMIKQLLDEVRAAPLDEASRRRLMEIHRSSIDELEKGLAPELVDELERLTLPFGDEAVPSDAELRIAQAQLVGWLEGLFHGIQTALFAQQMAARAQLEQMRRALPPGHPAAMPDPSAAQPDQGRQHGGGMYL